MKIRFIHRPSVRLADNCGRLPAKAASFTLTLARSLWPSGLNFSFRLWLRPARSRGKAWPQSRLACSSHLQLRRLNATQTSELQSRNATDGQRKRPADESSSSALISRSRSLEFNASAQLFIRNISKRASQLSELGGYLATQLPGYLATLLSSEPTSRRRRRRLISAATAVAAAAAAAAVARGCQRAAPVAFECATSALVKAALTVSPETPDDRMAAPLEPLSPVRPLTSSLAS